MTVKRKALSVFACVILVLSLVPIIAYADDTEPDGGTTPTEAVGEIETNALESEQETPQEEGEASPRAGTRTDAGMKVKGRTTAPRLMRPKPVKWRIRPRAVRSTCSAQVGWYAAILEVPRVAKVISYWRKAWKPTVKATRL